MRQCHSHLISYLLVLWPWYYCYARRTCYRLAISESDQGKPYHPNVEYQLPKKYSQRISHVLAWATDPITSLVLRIYCQSIEDRNNGDHTQAGRIRKFLKSLTSLGHSHLTELRLLEIAANCRFDQYESHHTWCDSIFPPFKLCVGDLGFVVRAADGEEAWKVLEASSDNDGEVSFSKFKLCLPGIRVGALTKAPPPRMIVRSVWHVRKRTANGEAFPAQILSTGAPLSFPAGEIND